jgi:UDP-N-acetyl-D-mannosaminuronic acid dehydrogenase
VTTKLEKKICVIGLGYVGLPTAAVLASRGYNVRGVDVNRDAIDTINSGQAHIIEPDLDMLVRAAVQTGMLRAYEDAAEADVFLICVPTPLKESREPDLGAVGAAVRSIAPVLRAGNLVILESTSPPGTTETVAQVIEEVTELTRHDVHIAHAPERVLPGRVLREVVENDRVVGGLTKEATQAARAFYETFVSGTVGETTARTAETAKLVENAYRDVNIAFANELSIVADELNLDVWELIDLANRHPRVNILSPGTGVGGHCIAVDPWFLVHAAPDATSLIRQARNVNDHKPEWVISHVARCAGKFKHPTIACLGLSYKPDIDDLRESPAVHVVRSLRSKLDATVLVVEPHLSEHDEFEITPLEAALEQADIVVVLVAHKQFAAITPLLMAEKIVIDPCGAMRNAAS